jgi:hypothetical protein
MDTTKVRSAFPSANKFQGQQKTPQSLSVVLFAGCCAMSYLLQHVPTVRNCPRCKWSKYSIPHYCANCTRMLVFKTTREMMPVHKTFDTGLENPLWLVVFLITLRYRLLYNLWLLRHKDNIGIKDAVKIKCCPLSTKRDYWGRWAPYLAVK